VFERLSSGRLRNTAETLRVARHGTVADRKGLFATSATDITDEDHVLEAGSAFASEDRQKVPSS